MKLVMLQMMSTREIKIYLSSNGSFNSEGLNNRNMTTQMGIKRVVYIIFFRMIILFDRRK